MSMSRWLGHRAAGTFTGKPVVLGGSLGRTEATGLGGFYVLGQLAAKQSLKKDETKIVVQGFGNVGYWFAYFAYKAGYRVVAISDSRSVAYDEAGLNPEEVMKHKRKHGRVSLDEMISPEDVVGIEADVLAPAALEHAINEKNVSSVKARLVLELANGPTTPGAERVLIERDVVVVPDVLANAGGVSVSYFEWVQNLYGYHWKKQVVF